MRKLLFVFVGLLFFGCEKENGTIPVKDSTYQTASLNEINSLLNLASQNAAKGEEHYVTFNINDIGFEEITESDAEIAVIPAKTIHKEQHSRILLLKINDTVKSLVFNMYHSAKEQTEFFTGRASISDLNGNITKAYMIKNGVIITTYKASTKNNQTSGKDEDSAECRSFCGHESSDVNCMCNGIYLDEVVVTNTPPVPVFQYVSIASMYGGEPYESGNTQEWDMGGGGGINNSDNDDEEEDCQLGYTKDENGNCVQTNPCNDIKTQIANPNIASKINILKGKIGDTKETGFSQNKNGTFTTLTNTSSHELDFPINPGMVGFMHTHIRDFTKTDINGNTKSVKTYKIFSPEDVVRFLRIVEKSRHTSVNTNEVYGTVISSRGTYTLRFTGNINNVNANIDAKNLRPAYEKLIKKMGLEKGFLHFLKNEIKINGISLYKVESNGNVEEKILNSNNKVDKIPCN